MSVVATLKDNYFEDGGSISVTLVSSGMGDVHFAIPYSMYPQSKARQRIFGAIASSLEEARRILSTSRRTVAHLDTV